MQAHIIRRSAEILAVTMAYYVAARFALLLAIPPGYATAVWPSAGIALSALLLFGYHVAPGILLGSFLANVATSFDPVSTATLLRSILLPLSISVGATLQGLAGAVLIRRFVGFPTALDRGADIIKFLVLGGPVSCVISASVGVASLILTGTLPLHSYPINWCIWWVGDTIGTVIVTPLALTWRGEPRDIWRRRRSIVTFPLCLTFVVIVGVFIGARGDFLNERQSLASWAVLAGGLAFTALSGAFLLVVSGHMILIERLAVARAAELKQRRMAEEMLRREQSQLRAILDNAPVLIFIKDLQGRMMLANRRFLEVLDVPPSVEFFGHSVFDLFPRDVAEQLRTNDIEALDGDRPVQAEQNICLKDGAWHTYLNVKFPVRYLDTEEPFGICAICMDITKQRETEEELGKFKFFSENANDAHFLINQEMRILYANKLACERLGYSQSELLQLSIPDIAPLFQKQRVLELFEQCRRGRSPPFEALHRRKDGSMFPVEITSTVLEFKREWLMFSTVRDITERKLVELALRESEAQLRATFDQAAVGIVHLARPCWHFLHANKAFCRMSGYSGDELLTLTESAITYPEDRQIGMEQYSLLTAGAKTSFTMKKRYVCKQGQVIWVRITVSAIRDVNNRVLYMMSVIEDITHAKLSDQARQDTERRLELAVGIAQLGFWEWNIVTDELYWSPLFKKQLGYEDNELSSCHAEWKSRLHPEERNRVLDYLACYVAQPTAEYELEYRLRHRDGSYRWFLTRAISVRGEDGKVVTLVGIHLDVTEHKMGEQRIRKAALHDPLTGLPNRALVFEYAGHLLAVARRNLRCAALLFIDLDRFKPINDLYGHEIGDRLLIEVTKRLRDCVRQEDLVGRLGGDEFVVMLPNLDSDYRAETVARHILNEIERPIHIDSHELSVSLSIGISHFPKHGEDIDTLIHAADVAMYQAKQSGRANYQFYVPEFDRCADELLSIEMALKRALNSDGLTLHYQPVIDMKSGQALGAEALLRLSSREMADVFPHRFIPVAESAGMISRLGEWVAAEACRQHTEWVAQGMPPIQIAINVSPLQFRQGAFMERLIRIVSDSGIDPAFLQLEVTESTVMENVDEAVKTLQRIKVLGMKVALDDFGTGYSSLSHLSTLPLDRLKVDQSFIRRIGHDRTSRAITKAIIVLGHTLKLEVVGEGIESEDALDYLRKQGCDQAQGFLFSSPLPADEFAKWYRMR